MQPNAFEEKCPMSSDVPIHMSATTLKGSPDEACEPQSANNQSKRLYSSTNYLRPHSQAKSRKRIKKSNPSNSSTSVNFIRSDVHRSAENLRQEGISPNTLFFPSLSDDMKTDDNLRTAIGLALEDLKTTHVRGKKMAWARFSTESECLDALLRLRLSNPALKVSIHRPKNTTGPNAMCPLSNNIKTFQKRLDEVRRNGGGGNTLMFRNLPNEVQCDELRDLLREAIEKVETQDHCPPLRIRTALSKKGNGRNFWVVYASVSSCQAAFVAIHLKSVSFRCGRTMKIHAFLHDDSTDADEKRRRERAIDLGVQGIAPISEMDSFAPKMTNLELLENFLRQNRTSYVFMSPENRNYNR